MLSATPINYRVLPQLGRPYSVLIDTFEEQWFDDEHSNNLSEPKLDTSVGHFAADGFGCIAPGKSEGLWPIDEGSPLPPWYQA